MKWDIRLFWHWHALHCWVKQSGPDPCTVLTGSGGLGSVPSGMHADAHTCDGIPGCFTYA